MKQGAAGALRLLLTLKLRGAVRKQIRRMKTLKGLVLTLVGGGLFLLWLASLVVHWVIDPTPRADEEIARTTLGLMGVALLFVTLSSALAHRGLFVPREEIERLFAAPIPRSDLVRYRLAVHVGRGLFGGVVLALVLLRHLPHPLYGFLGTLITALTLPIVGQIAAILSGALERVAFQRLKRLGSLSLPVSILLGLAIAALAIGGGGVARGLQGIFGAQAVEGVLEHPLVQALTRPLMPWVSTMTASSFPEFAPWCALCLAIAAGLIEFAARLPVDFRELSLETSANVAERLRRAGTVGRSASGGKVSRRFLAWRVPWVLGRGPAGAIAWRKTGAILRKARGTLLISVVMLAFVIFFASMLFDEPEGQAPRAGGVVLVAVLGLLYLSGGLRFDFRDELERMESIKAWPLSARAIFFAMLLPQVLLISVLLAAAVAVQSALEGRLSALALGVLLAMPLCTFAWSAIDNAVFLVLPVRAVPGQEGALLNAGRALLLTFLRLLLFTLTGAVAGLAAAGVWFGLHALFPDGESADSLAPAWIGAYAAAWFVFLLLDVALLELGALAFRRFDVGRDRG